MPLSPPTLPSSATAGATGASSPLVSAILGLLSDPIVATTGLNADQLKTQGGALYPEEGPDGAARNFPAHRLASRRMVQRTGSVPITAAAGVANELLEAVNRIAAGSDAPLIGNTGQAMIDLGDLGANVRGIAEGVSDAYITPQGTDALRRLLLAQAQRFMAPQPAAGSALPAASASAP